MQQKTFVIIIAAIAALGGLLFGYDTGVISGAILYIKQSFTLTPTVEGLIIGAVLLGALFGALGAGRIADHYGRKPVILVTSIIFIIGSLATAFAGNVATLIIGRFVLGISIGIASFTAPLYIAEVAPYRYRGALVSLNQLAITVGIVLSYIIDYSFANVSGSWHWMLGCGIIPALTLLIGMLFLPSSPRWLVLRGSTDKARNILKTIRHANQVEDELADIEASVQQKKQHRGQLRDLLAPWLRPALVIGFGLAFLQQMTGINTIIYYAPTIFNMAGFGSNAHSILATSVVGLLNVIATLIAIPLVDKIGRRPLLLFGLFGMGASLFILGLVFALHSHLAIIKWITLASMLVYIACFACSLGIIVWIILSEVFPLSIRGVGMSAATAATWGFNFIVSFTFLLLIQALSISGTFWLYALLCAGGWLFVYRLMPETKGITLEAIEQNLRQGKSARKLGI